MIFVVLGTFELPFDRLLKEVDKQISAGNIKEEVLVQAGHTKYRSNQMEFIDFTTYEHMAELYRESNLIITHGGTGSITMGMKMGKKMIAVPRLVKYGEHNDNHQIEIVRQFHQTGHILSWDDNTDMSVVLKEVETFKPAPFKSGNKEILNILRNFIDGI
ncbi:PssE/Cps14G family polysaccharide biosynthesis glycosyltransferase [Niallia endozanthoxylica]|uniref:Exopolysaccharide biosynthesis protein n=1 Tax=Niallia endozanthoxylica TaxID=2036016 RepID=A0A5J5H6C1_9BACI|nr:PssE/Cps14G family polysaccharide biosynthesis glycosyltransferase [Niallia endozanthoxylica]KAA9015478.1 exopolysaccharide biosynthesis protein [Niallia endozanthoxylica]